MPDDIGSVFANPAEERGADAELVAHAEETKSGRAERDAAPVRRIAVEAEHRELDPAEVRAEARAPDDRCDIAQRAAAFEHHPLAASNIQGGRGA